MKNDKDVDVIRMEHVIKNVDCSTCANLNTKWCGGCEYNFPSVDNFDFYREIENESEE